MHTKPMRIADGKLSAWTKSAEPCSECGQIAVRYRVWESSCGGYEDVQHRCDGCGRSWWVEGPDA
jgi:hypothetical protein